MAPAVEASGTQTATISTEHTLNADWTTAKTRVVTINLGNMALGDTVEIRLYNKVLTGDTVGSTVLQDLATFQHVQSQPVLQIPPIVVAYGGRVTLKQTAGTGRNFPFNITTLD